MEKLKKPNLFTVLAIFGIAMGFLEAVVVVYLRELYCPQGFTFPLHTVPTKIFSVELFREATTIIMLICVAIIAGKNSLQCFAFFIYTFGVWDIFYYIGLKLMLNWPPSLLTWDILFLIPFPWAGPVLAPVICSITMISFAVCIVYFQEKGYAVIIKWYIYTLVLSGSLIILFTYIWDYGKIVVQNGLFSNFLILGDNERFQQIMAHYVPTSYNWYLFFIGETLLLIALALIIWKTVNRINRS